MTQYAQFEDINLSSNVTLSIAESGKTVEAVKKMDKTGKIISMVIIYALLIAMAIIVILPFYWMIISSLKTNEEIRQSEQTLFPTIVMWSNYVYVFDQFRFITYMRNTIVVAIFSTAGTLITTVFAAFAFARLKFKGRDGLFLVFLMTMMIPGEMMVISNYITVASFGWIGEGQTITEAYLAMIVPFLVSVFHIYLLRQNFKQIPNELYLAAKVDGKTDWAFLWRIMVPLAAPTLISVAILKFMGTWNSYVWPNLIANSDDFKLISNGLRGTTFTDPETSVVSYAYQMAATVLVTVPLFLLFIFFRKYIMRGVGRAGIKG